MGFLANLFRNAHADSKVARDEAGKATGAAGSIGLHNDADGPNTSQVASANLGVGTFQNRAGETNTGIAGDAALLKLGSAPGSTEAGGNGLPVGGELGVGTASANATVNASTASLGAQANAIEGAVSVGNEEHSLRAGLSMGVGAAGRVHYGDADKDGIREMGLGFDAGPVSMDVKTELLGRIWNFFTGGGAKEGDASAAAAQPEAQAVPKPPPAATEAAPVPAPPQPAPRLFPNSPLASDEDVHERLTR
jgi:hypothetical protein